MPELPSRADVVVIGAGHNGLVAATLLARAGLDVAVLEAADVLGGACRTEHPFPRAPELAASTGAYLLGLMPPELLTRLGLDLPLVRRDPHYFLPTLDGRHLLLGSDRAATRQQYERFFSPADWTADVALQAELGTLRDDLAPAWLAEPLPVEQTAERYLRPSLRSTFVDLVRGSAVDYLSRFGFASEALVAMYAVTDGMPGLAGSPYSPGSGHNLLVHNMCRLPGADGTWMVVRGGLGTVTARIAAAAAAAGASLHPGHAVARVLLDDGHVSGVETSRGRVASPVVLAATDPYRLPGLVGGALPAELLGRITGWAQRPGMTLKVNLALSGLPRFAALPESVGQHGTTVHLLPPPAADGSVLTAVRAAYDDASAGRLPLFPPLEWYLHSTLDPSLRDSAGNHSSALFVQGVPAQVAGSSWAAERDGYVEHLLGVAERFAPGLRDLVVDVSPLAPPDIETHFGITGGNIFHVDNAVSFTDRMPYATGLPGLYAGAAGCHPAGSVIGAAGHNAAQRILADVGLPPSAG
ncbi:MAG: NAD(P)/FAD-dependent oxidoreductase [Actinomycetota bacterium]|nr:NAD(P)/FAD-dependent oxidoreductase [Actinomycetota bacterium]